MKNTRFLLLFDETKRRKEKMLSIFTDGEHSKEKFLNLITFKKTFYEQKKSTIVIEIKKLPGLGSSAGLNVQPFCRAFSLV